MSPSSSSSSSSYSNGTLIGNWQEEQAASEVAAFNRTKLATDTHTSAFPSSSSQHDYRFADQHRTTQQEQYNARLHEYSAAGEVDYQLLFTHGAELPPSKSTRLLTTAAEPAQPHKTSQHTTKLGSASWKIRQDQNTVTDPYATTYNSTYQPLNDSSNTESISKFQKKPMLAKTIDSAYHSLQLRKGG